MNYAEKAMLSIALIVAFGTASAVPITDFIDAVPDVTITSSAPYAFTHLITDGATGYVPGVDTITSALLSIRLTDQGGSETFQILIGSGGTQQVFSDNNVPSSRTYDISLVASLADLAADGSLNVILTAQSGSYRFADSTLTAQVTRGEGPLTSVPEPAPFALLGIGLLGISVYRRKPAKN